MKVLNLELVIIFALYSRELEYDGIVLESWSRWAAYGVLFDPDMRKMVLCSLIYVSTTLMVTSLLSYIWVCEFNLLGTAIRKTTWRYTSLHDLTEK